jgi:carbonic anhydrase/acetyltransferase-like protein (isoleucine patch superfamily)
MQIPDGSLVLGSPAAVRKTLSAEQQQALALNAEHYVANAARFARELEVRS